MDLAYTPQQQAFRAEVRAWMAAHVPKVPLDTLECREGYDQHVEWERTLASGNWGMVTGKPRKGDYYAKVSAKSAGSGIHCAGARTATTHVS